MLLFLRRFQLQAAYDAELRAYLDSNGLKPSDLVKPPKVQRKKETSKKLPATLNACTGETQPSNADPEQTASSRPDDLLVYHVRADGTQECYVQRAVAAGVAAAEGRVHAGDEREMLLSTLAEQTHNVTQLRLQLLNARGRIVELEQQNDLLRQLMRDAQLTTSHA